jgi:hypothetical protein
MNRKYNPHAVRNWKADQWIGVIVGAIVIATLVLGWLS